ncbi:hypothetical protein [Arthrobacter oryzae]|jgi:vancomycin resistance protein YoaR|uniref:hypothetical protein n=1 Tax=Arthrobacter oryzae TaxID=409290 RepID=UPI00285F288A|nr:hypothetical protein [Arthrobacter oryzae]MDR6505542.1 vancomycin resistance protein YoaR [Arthrobacter oryzae]
MSTSTPEQKKSRTPRHASTSRGRQLTPSEHRVQVAAAKLRVALDERLGRPTPAETKALSKEDL